jgi:protein-disulfide isomerase
MFVEFGDLQCPACAQVAPTVRELRREFGDRVRFVFRHFPLDSVHEYALPAAEASECAARQGKFWEAVDRFYQAQGALDAASLERYAGELRLDAVKYRACIANKESFPQIQSDVNDGRALGVRSTPTFFVGDRRLVGAVALSDFEKMLKDDLAVAGIPASSTGASAAPADKEKSGADETKTPYQSRVAAPTVN